MNTILLQPQRRVTPSIPFHYWIVFLVHIATAPCSSQNNFIRGADVSWLQQIEDAGGTFFESGNKKDALAICKDHGFNYIRLRIWHTPTNGYNNLPHTLLVAERAKKLGMKLLLDFHFSDWWADPGKQTKPAAWNGLSFSVLKDSVKNYVHTVFAAMKKNNTVPDMVQFGNEIICGMLWNEGNVCDSNNTPQHWKQLAELLSAANQGMNEVLVATDTVRTMIHIDRGGNYNDCIWFYDNLLKQNFNFDIIGLSYYPWWHGTLSAVTSNLQKLSTKYNKDIIIVESGYPWTLLSNDNENNIVGLQSQLQNDYPATVDGQKKFFIDLINIICATPNNRGIGIFYWEPDAITAPRLTSPWENIALFDFNGNVLTSIQAFENNPTLVQSTKKLLPKIFSATIYPNPCNPTTTIEVQLPATQQIAITIFNALGQSIAQLYSGTLSAGKHSFTWNAENFPSGIFFCTVKSHTFIEAKKIILLR